MRVNNFGIKTITINGNSVYTINVSINSIVLILGQIINDEFWKLKHNKSIKHSGS